MESAEKTEGATPRRSVRLQRQRAVTPDTKVLGPRALMKFNRSRQNLDLDQTSAKVPVEIIVTAPTPIRKNNRKTNTEEETGKTENLAENDTKEIPDPMSVEKDEEQKEKHPVEVTVNKIEQNVTEEFHSAITENEKSEDITIKTAEKEESEEGQPSINQPAENDDKVMNKEAGNMNETPQLMDESIISVPESPPLTKSTAAINNSTFSPEVDTSIHDARPHIDKTENATPFVPRNVTLRTSTPLSQRILMRDTPKLPANVINALNIMIPSKVGDDKKLNDESMSNGQFKMVNALEKSILKSSRRKRSLSVTDGESFMQKKVMFMSPEIMNIDTIDEKMIQSFKEEKENSILMHAHSSGGVHRKRSLSVSSTPGKAKIKVPNFKAIHEQQFKKMESIADHVHRKAERAKRLVTPSKALSTLPEIKEKNSGASSKIPTRKPLNKVSSSENILHSIKSRPMKRSNSTETQQKSSSSKFKFEIGLKTDLHFKDVEKKVGTVGKNIPTLSKNDNKIQNPSKLPTPATTKPIPSTSKPSSSSQAMRSKVDERREKNMSLYKGNVTKTGLDHRKKNENVLKGVRLNRRFELQMKHRRLEDAED